MSGREVKLAQLEGNMGIELANSRFSSSNVESDEWQLTVGMHCERGNSNSSFGGFLDPTSFVWSYN